MNLLLNDITLQYGMLKKNLARFERRFPELGQKLHTAVSDKTADISAAGLKIAESIEGESSRTDTDGGIKAIVSTFDSGMLFAPQDIAVFEAQNSQPSASYKGMLLHSRYNPAAEAQKILKADNIQKADTIVFFGAGIGYALAEAAHLYKEKTIVLIEPDPLRLLWAFSLFDWQAVFDVLSCIFLIDAPQQTVIALLERCGLHGCAFIMHKAWAVHAQHYFSNLHELIIRNKNKQDINERTLEKFGFLWLSNMCKNLRLCAELEGINGYKNSAGSLPFCILAAGPSLDAVLPFLPELKKRTVLVCVDTALRSCLRAKVEPHFIVVVDPQYWNARHIADLQAPNSILITESAAYPSVFRFKCRKIILCASMFPLGRYIEQCTDTKETLAAGGSVASTAWDFARFCGAETVYTAGLDLSYPANKTHAKGSTFEENVHYLSTKLYNGETQNAQAVYNNPAYKAGTKARDCSGKPVLTDSRMQLYAWWFESKCAAFPDVQTYTLSSKSLYIPGIKAEQIQNLLAFPVREKEIEAFCRTSNTVRTKICGNFTEAVLSLFSDLQELKNFAQEAVKLCNGNYRLEDEYAHVLNELSKIDKKIQNSKAAPVAALVFPSPSKLEKLFSERLPPEPDAPPSGSYITCAQYNMEKSKLVYQAIINSIETHIYYMQKNRIFS